MRGSTSHTIKPTVTKRFTRNPKDNTVACYYYYYKNCGTKMEFSSSHVVKLKWNSGRYWVRRSPQSRSPAGQNIVLDPTALTPPCGGMGQEMDQVTPTPTRSFRQGFPKPSIRTQQALKRNPTPPFPPSSLARPPQTRPAQHLAQRPQHTQLLYCCVSGCYAKQFIKAMGKSCPPPIPAPTTLRPFPTGSDDGLTTWSIDVPTTEELGLGPAPERDPRSVLPFEGGETAGLRRVRQYIWDEDRLREYKVTRNGLLGSGFSSKFSPWLALGCISPRTVAMEVRIRVCVSVASSLPRTVPLHGRSHREH